MLHNYNYWLWHPTVFMEQVVAAIEDVDGVKKPLMKKFKRELGKLRGNGESFWVGLSTMTMTMILDADAVAEKMGWQAKPGRSDESNW
jgi:hypothetical protein